MWPVIEQVMVFTLSLLAGALIGNLLDCYQVLRRFWVGRTGTALATDVLIWIGLSFLVFYLLLVATWGELRLYFFMGLALGFWIYHRYLRRASRYFWERSVLGTVWTGRRVIAISAAPVVGLFKVLLLVKRKIQRLVSYLGLAGIAGGKRVGRSWAGIWRKLGPRKKIPPPGT